MGIITVKDVHKTYVIKSGLWKRKTKRIKALSDISFSINKGEVFCPIGPNGAGKTTLIKILSTLLVPDEGSVIIDGCCAIKDTVALRKKIGVLYGGERGLYWRLSARDNLQYFGNLYEVEPKVLSRRIDELLDIVGMSSRQHDRVETFSKGMKQRIHFARCLLHDPMILFLDEPTLGLDPEFSHDIRDLIRGLQSKGKTIVLTSHYMEEIEKLADKIGLIYQGQMKEICTPEEFRSEFSNVNLEEAYLKVLNKKRA